MLIAKGMFVGWRNRVQKQQKTIWRFPRSSGFPAREKKHQLKQSQAQSTKSYFGVSENEKLQQFMPFLLVKIVRKNLVEHIITMDIVEKNMLQQTNAVSWEFLKRPLV